MIFSLTPSFLSRSRRPGPALRFWSITPYDSLRSRIRSPPGLLWLSHFPNLRRFLVTHACFARRFQSGTPKTPESFTRRPHHFPCPYHLPVALPAVAAFLLCGLHRFNATGVTGIPRLVLWILSATHPLMRSPNLIRACALP